LNKEQLENLEQKIIKAKNQEKKSVKLDGDIEIKQEDFDQILETIGKVKAKWREKSSRIILQIKDNIDKKEFEATIEQRKNDIFIPENQLKTNVKLLHHQLEGIKRMQELYIGGFHGVLLGDDMGLGKTLQTLVFLAWRTELEKKYGNKVDPILIVAPVSLIENWKDEYEKFLKPLWGNFYEIHGSKLSNFRNSNTNLKATKETDLNEEEIANLLEKDEYFLLDLSQIEFNSAAITTYETLRNYQFSFAKKKWSTVVVDEAQKMKNPTSMVSNAIKALECDFAVAITGTPVENSWIDLWNLIDFIQPGFLASLIEFNKKFVLPLKNKDVDILEIGKELMEKINPFLIRRIKENILEGLPQKYENQEKETLPDIQLNTYIEAIKNFQQQVDRKHIFEIIAKLRDISLHPYLYKSLNSLETHNDEEFIEASARFKILFKIIEKIKEKDEKLVIFLESKKLQQILKRIIYNKYGIETFIINGETKPSLRKNFIDNFQRSNGFNIIILSPLAAGVGLTITAANHVIHLNRLWNPAKEDQATDRVYRIGQEKDVYINIPIGIHEKLEAAEYKGSFDEKLNRLLERKRKLSRSVLIPSIITETDIMEDILETPTIKEPSKSSIDINGIDSISGENFEKFVGNLYRHLGYRNAHVTPLIGDNGADVVVIDKEKGNFLIQCKHVSNPKQNIQKTGVQEIISAKNLYEKNYDCKFELIVFTNAEGFTSGATQLAEVNNVKLMKRIDLKNIINEHKISISSLLF